MKAERLLVRPGRLNCKQDLVTILIKYLRETGEKLAALCGRVPQSLEETLKDRDKGGTRRHRRVPRAKTMNS